MLITHWSNKSILLLNGHPIRLKHIIGGVIAAPIVYVFLYVTLSI